MRRNVAQQALALRNRYPAANVQLRSSRLVWDGSLQPTETSAEYRVRVMYQSPRYPVATVLTALATRGEDAIPHRYSDGSLCLHRPGEWNSQMLIADTIIVWTSEWLFFYELWLPTGVWYGSGEWPPSRKSPVTGTNVETDRQGELGR